MTLKRDKFKKTVQICTNNDSILTIDGIMNYPNPFNTFTSISFSLANGGATSVYINDIYGRKISKIISGNYSQGIYKVIFSATDLAPGIYLVVLQTQTNKKVIKIEKVN
jgi:hypothetical protein